MEPIFVRKLNRRERDILYDLMEDKKIGYRAKIIILSYEGYTPPQIEKAINMHVKNIRKWIYRFNKHGVKGILERNKRGRKPKIGKEIIERIIKIAQTPPHKLGLPFSTWSLRKLKSYLKDNGIEISHTRIRQILLKSGFRFWKSRQELISRDPDYEAKRSRILRFYKRPNCIVLCMDEKKIAIKEYGGYNWSKKRKVIPLNQRVRDTIVMFGIYDLHRNWRYFDFYPDMKSRSFIKFVKKVVKKFEDRIYLILDNHPSHVSKRSKEELNKIKKLKLVYLPFNSPKLNRIEEEFSLLQKEVINNRKFECCKEIILAIRRWAWYRNKMGTE